MLADMRATIDAAAWQASWDRQQAAYMPDREQRFTALFDVVEATASGDTPAILDLAGGTGSISLRALRRFPRATTTLVDIDPVLLAIAQSSVDDRTTVVTADLRQPGWVDRLPRRGYDAVLTATALHWLEEERLAALYGEIRDVLRPGGVFVNADHMPDAGLPGLSAALQQADRTRRETEYAGDATLSWEGWWDRLSADPDLGPLLDQRRQVFDGPHAVDFAPASEWHERALRAAGFTEVGLVWRGLRDAAVAGVH
jgi:SAM-dependent methyltransferase